MFHSISHDKPKLPSEFQVECIERYAGARADALAPFPTANWRSTISNFSLRGAPPER